MRTIHCYWFPNSTGEVGIVVAENSDGIRKAFIGRKITDDEKMEVNRIINWGAPLSPKVLSETLNDIISE